MKILTYLDSRAPGFSRKALFNGLVENGFIEQHPWYDEDVEHLMNHLNGQIITSQLLGVPLVLGATQNYALHFKLGAHGASVALDETHALKEFLESSLITVPQGILPKQVLKLRNSDASAELRKTLSKCVTKAQSGENTVTEHLVAESRAALQDLNEHAKSFGETSVAILTGAFGTIGGVLGGAAGAIIGGIGGTATSLAVRPAIHSLYKTTHRNWAFYFHEWAQRSKQ